MTEQKERIEAILRESETGDLLPPYRCLPLGNPEWIKLKAIRILATIKEAGYAKLVDERPKVICLCGSTRFTDIMLIQQWEFTKQGFIVLSWCALPDWYFKGAEKSHIGDQEGVKEIVDEVHLRKIDLSDEVFVINKDGYIGESTKREIEYAKSIGKPVRYLVSSK